MAKDVIMPALGMAQETGTLLRWIKSPGETVVKGEPLMEVETDKAAVEIEAPASGILAAVTAKPGDVIPVGQRIALILAPGETAPAPEAAAATPRAVPAPSAIAPTVNASPLAARMAAEQGLDLARIKPAGGRVQKEDVLAYLAAAPKPSANRRTLASPKARRFAQERGLDLAAIAGSGPDGAVLAADVLALPAVPASPAGAPQTDQRETLPVSRVWRVMAERVVQAWTTIPQFYLMREVNASRLIAWRESAQKGAAEKITYTDLLTALVASALRRHLRLNASWNAERGTIVSNPDVNIGLAVAVEDGLVVPVIRKADQLGLGELAARRAVLVAKAQSGKLLLPDISDGTFTISNLGMYGVDAFIAIVNPPQAAILAVSRITDRVVPLNGQPAVQPMMTLNLSCDHRVVDGARAAQFLQTLADLIEDPQRSLD